jgi:hypothetical protein
MFEPRISIWKFSGSSLIYAVKKNNIGSKSSVFVATQSTIELAQEKHAFS